MRHFGVQDLQCDIGGNSAKKSEQLVNKMICTKRAENCKENGIKANSSIYLACQ